MGVRMTNNEKPCVGNTFLAIALLLFTMAMCITTFMNQNEINKLRVELRQASSDVAEMKKMLDSDMGMEIQK